MRRVFALGGVLTVLAMAFVGVSAANTGVGAKGRPVETTPLRAVRIVDHAWHRSCSADQCGSTDFPLRSFDIPLPPGTGRFDVVLSLTMDYLVSSGDRAEVHVFHCPKAEPPIPCPLQYLAPDRLPLASSGATTTATTTTTLQWVGRSFRTGDYLGWHYQVHVILIDGSGDRRVTMSGRKMVAGFEMTPTQ